MTPDQQQPSPPRPGRTFPAPAHVWVLTLVAVVAATSALVGPASAQGDLCFGRQATIVVRAPGQTTVGTSGDDVIVGTSGPDTIHGGGGNDRICGGDGDDRIHGDAGRDLINGGGGDDEVWAGRGNDRVIGSAGADRLRGNRGNDTLAGRAGRDVLVGGPGADRLEGDRGRDRCIPNAGRGSFDACERITARQSGCILSLHGAGTPPGSIVNSWRGGLLYLQPHSGNPEPPWFWLYDGPHNTRRDPGDSDKPYNDLVAMLTETLDAHGCGPTMLYGASNGGGFAARIYCSGEDFDGRLWGVFVDDPVPDAGVVGCSPSPRVERSLFVHSTEVVTEAARFRNNRCSRSPTLQWPWYCQDDTGFDLEEYEAHIGQESVWGRENHVGRNRDAVNFWKQASNWWYQHDPVTYAALGR